MTNRREFIKGTAWMGALAFAAGCMGPRGFGFGEGGSMQGFRMKPMKRIRVGVLGVGGRGTGAVHRIAMIPGCEVAVICDKKPEQIKVNLDWFQKQKIKAPQTFCGEEEWKRVCDGDLVDVVYVTTPWALHAPMALRALRNGKPAFVEVPAALTVDECWDLVETSEKTHLPCMILENCCYGEMEMLGLHLAKLGLLGEIVHGEGAYIHDLRTLCDASRGRESEWRYYENVAHKGNRYPTHGLVPLMQAMDINRGDRFDYLVSLESKQANCKAYLEALFPNSSRAKDVMAMGDINTTLIKTVRGRSIVVQHDVSSPRPYTRIDMLTGTKGIFWGMPWRTYGKEKTVFKMGFEASPGKGVHGFMPERQADEWREKYKHPLWKKIGEVAKKVGGHGGMDFIMDLRWAYCLQNGLPLDMDVYDLATTSCLCELTERSVRNRSASVDVPDFTRGNWKKAAPLGIVDIDLDKIDFKNVRKDNAALNV